MTELKKSKGVNIFVNELTSPSKLKVSKLISSFPSSQ